jgi:hypothetical protein
MADSETWTAHGAEISERSTELVLPEDRSIDSPAETYVARESMRDEGGSGLSDSRTTHANPPPGDASATRGAALPGDRGPRAGRATEQRPSFWRRIALGRRTGEPAEEGEWESDRAVVPRAAPAPSPIAARELEKQIVEPMLQALVSVEAKLERSHVELVGRSDQVEQRLSQLWDIEEQLGTLSELQESLQRVSEQQRRLESAIQAQTRAVRWVIGAVFVSLAAAAFVVAAVLR